MDFLLVLDAKLARGAAWRGSLVPPREPISQKMARARVVSPMFHSEWLSPLPCLPDLLLVVERWLVEVAEAVGRRAASLGRVIDSCRR